MTLREFLSQVGWSDLGIRRWRKVFQKVIDMDGGPPLHGGDTCAEVDKALNDCLQEEHRLREIVQYHSTRQSEVNREIAEKHEELRRAERESRRKIREDRDAVQSEMDGIHAEMDRIRADTQIEADKMKAEYTEKLKQVELNRHSHLLEASDKKYYLLTVLECPTPVWRHYVEYRGWIEAGPHEWAISPLEPKSDMCFEGRVLGMDAVRYDVYKPEQRFQNVVKIGMTAADVGKSVIVELPANSDAIPQRVGVLARGAHFSPYGIYGMPSGNPVNFPVIEGNDEQGTIKYDIRPIADDRYSQYGDGLISYELIH